MGTEYYIVKPKTKQAFYLGKRISYLDGLSNMEPKYPEWEYWEDVVFDLQQNSRYFLEGGDMTVGQVWDFCNAIYEFCDSKVFLGDDCDETDSITNYKNWKDYEVIDVFDDIFSTPSELEKWCDLIQLIPPEEWVTRKEDGISVIYERETVANYLKKIKEEKLEQSKTGGVKL